MDYFEFGIKTINTEKLGSLSFFESGIDIPFEIKRVYFIHGVPADVTRGGHAHTNLQQLLFCPYGEIDIILSNGDSKEIIKLDEPNKGLYIGNNIWRDMIWKEKNSILCVAASEYYTEEDYIRDYSEFLRVISSNKTKGELT